MVRNPHPEGKDSARNMQSKTRTQTLGSFGGGGLLLAKEVAPSAASDGVFQAARQGIRIGAGGALTTAPSPMTHSAITL